MAGDILSEQRLTLSQAARVIGVHTATVHRWHLKGVNGVKLSTVVIGGLRWTSRERLDDFIAATTAAADGSPPSSITSRQRKAEIREAERFMDAEGF